MGYFDHMDRAYLDALDNEYSAAEARPASQYVDLPDGNYQAYIDTIMVKESKKVKGQIGLYITLKVVNNQYYSGAKVSMYNAIDMDRMEGLKTTLSRMEFPYDGIRSLEDEQRLSSMLDVIMDITVKHKLSEKTGKEYMNVYLNRRVGIYEHGESDAPAPDPNNDLPWGSRY